MRVCVRACTVFEKLFQKVDGENVSLARTVAFTRCHDFKKILSWSLSIQRPTRSTNGNPFREHDSQAAVPSAHEIHVATPPPIESRQAGFHAVRRAARRAARWSGKESGLRRRLGRGRGRLGAWAGVSVGMSMGVGAGCGRDRPWAWATDWG